MGAFTIWHWLVVGGVALLLFGGRGKVSELMGDFAKGIRAFKKGLSDEDEPAKGVPDASSGEVPRSLPHQAEAARPAEPVKTPADRAV